MHQTIEINTHVRPHLDEIAAIWMVQKWGEHEFPGADSARIVYWNAGPVTPDGRPASAYEAEGHLLIGVGGGRIDEHSTRDKNRKEGVCAASLMAIALRLDDDPALRLLLQYITNNDLKGGTGRFELGSLVSCLHRAHPNDPDFVLKWTFQALEALYAEQSAFFQDAKDEYEAKAVVEMISGPGKRTLRLAVIESDHDQIGPFSRSPFAKDGPADVLVQKRTNGQVMIFTNKKNPVKLYDLIQMLRIEEQLRKGQLVTTDFKELSREGTVAGAEEWYFQESAQIILNGSKSAPMAKATAIPLDAIVSFVKISLNPTSFEPSRENDCQQNRCTHSPRNRCGWQAYGLQRCRQIRFNARNNDQPIPAARLKRW